MVNQTEQPAEANETPVDTGNTTTDITEEFAGVDTFEDVSPPSGEPTTEPSSSQEGQGDTNEASSSPSTAPLVTEEAPPVAEEAPAAGNLQQRMSQLEQQNALYQRSQYETQLNDQYTKYRTDLEANGYMPEQAEHVAQNWLQQASEQGRLQQQQEEYAQFVQGQAVAAEHFAGKYKLNIGDLRELRQHQDPQSMEAAAKRMASDREKDARIAELEAQLVPQQPFNDNQSTPAASNDEDRWLERYNDGDRSPQAQAAAKRAAGLG